MRMNKDNPGQAYERGDILDFHHLYTTKDCKGFRLKLLNN